MFIFFMSTRLVSWMPKSWMSLLIWVRIFYLRNLQRAEVSNVGPCFNQAELVQIRHRRRRRRLGSRIPRETISMAFQRVSSRAEVGSRHSSSSGRQAHHYHSFRLTLSWPTNFRPDFIRTCTKLQIYTPYLKPLMDLLLFPSKIQTFWHPG